MAAVSISGGASNRTVAVFLTDTDFTRAGTRVTRRSFRTKYSIKNTSFMLGHSEFIFTLNAAKSNPRGAKIILLFAAGFG